MGWFISLCGHFSDVELKKAKSLHPAPLYKIERENFYLAAGGIPETCIAKISDNQKGWIVCGLGIKYENGEASFMEIIDWDYELNKKDFSPYHLNGHFAVVRWDADKAELFTDQLGVRNTYTTNPGKCIIFSTRPDWTARLNNSVGINWEEFGSRWLQFIQTSNNIYLTNVEVLNQGGKCVIDNQSLKVQISSRPWQSDLVPQYEHKDFISVLKDFTLFKFKDKRKSLALSGGIDSRILLAFLTTLKTDNWCVHSLHYEEHPDTKIAKRISEELNIEHIAFEPITFSSDRTIPLLKEYIGETFLAPPASKFSLMQFYSELYKQNKVIIDGTYGEIVRRRFFNRFLLTGKKAIYNRDYDKIITLLKSNRPNIFRENYFEIMKHGLRLQLEKVFDIMPLVEDYGVENWLDLLMIRFHMIKTTLEQARSDKMLLNYMPFVQPAVLKKAFEIPVRQRNNNLFYKIIKELSPGLSQIPLVKADIVYRFGLGNLSTSLLLKLKRKFGFYFRDNQQIIFLNNLSEYVQDTLKSTDVISCDYYDKDKIKNIVNGFYRDKNYSLASQLDWLLSFEIWRKIIEKK